MTEPSIKELLAGKKPRRALVPVLVSDPNADLTQLQGVSAALALAKENGDSDEVIVSLTAQLTECSAAVESHWAQVELHALPAREWEQAVAEWQTIEVNEDGPVAVMNWAVALAPLLARSCTDPDLQDAAWWTEQLSGDGWSEGDLDALRAAVLRLNIDAVEARAPKD